jgi:branched-subunit amino acid aminotransferase/4-amino-4-deoxychorismate lyase
LTWRALRAKIVGLNPYVQANTDGRLHPADQPSIAPLNRGYLYGDAIYEVWRTYHGVLFAWENHWTRLRASALALHLDLPFEPELILGEIRRTAAAHHAATGFAGELYVRLQIARGNGPIGLDVALAERPEFVILIQPCPALSPEKAQSGMRLAVAVGLRRNPAEALNPAWKTGNYLNNLLCLREARAQGADDVVILNRAGEVTEASVSNLAFMADGKFLTPPLSAGILGGVTRALILGGIAAAAGIPSAEAPINPADFGRMDECMLLSTTRDVVPVAAIDGARFSVPGPLTLRLKAAFAAYARRYAEEHRHWRVRD